MDWNFLLKTIGILAIIYILSYFNVTWIGLILAAVLIWSLHSDLKSTSLLFEEQKDKIKRLEEVIKKINS